MIAEKVPECLKVNPIPVDRFNVPNQVVRDIG